MTGISVEAATSLKDRDAWIKQLRQEFCPRDIIHQDGSINQSYFQPKSIEVQQIDWIRIATIAIYKGIEKHGVGEWEKIRNEFIPMMGDTEMELLTCAMFGIDTLVNYEKGWKGNEQKVKAEKKKNTKLFPESHFKQKAENLRKRKFELEETDNAE